MFTKYETQDTLYLSVSLLDDVLTFTILSKYGVTTAILPCYMKRNISLCITPAYYTSKSGVATQNGCGGELMAKPDRD